MYTNSMYLDPQHYFKDLVLHHVLMSTVDTVRAVQMEGIIQRLIANSFSLFSF